MRRSAGRRRVPALLRVALSAAEAVRSLPSGLPAEAVRSLQAALSAAEAVRSLPSGLPAAEAVRLLPSGLPAEAVRPLPSGLSAYAFPGRVFS